MMTSKIWKRCASATVIAVLAMTSAACSSGTSPSLDEVIYESEGLVERAEGPIIMEPRLGKGPSQLTFTPPAGDWFATVRCLHPEGEVGFQVSGEDYVTKPGPCGDGQGGRGGESSGEQVTLNIEAPEDMYWVAIVSHVQP